MYIVYFVELAQKERNLPKKYESKLSKVIKVFVGILIVASSILLWNWYKNNLTGWHSTILPIGAMIIIFLFLLYDELK